METDIETLVASLAETTANLQAYIEARADEIAGPLVAAAEQEYHAKATILRRQHKHDTDRWSDLNTELRRQLKARDRSSERLRAENVELRIQNQRVRMLRIDADARTSSAGFISTDELRAAIEGEEVAT